MRACRVRERTERDNRNGDTRDLRIRSPRRDPREPMELLLILCSQPSMHRRQRRLFVRELRVKVGRIHCVLDVREVRRRDLFVVDGVKVDVGEEGVLLDLEGVRLAGAESFGGVSLEELEGGRKGG